MQELAAITLLLPESTIGGDTTCIVCMVHPKSHIAVPCGHQSLYAASARSACAALHFPLSRAGSTVDARAGGPISMCICKVVLCDTLKVRRVGFVVFVVLVHFVPPC